MVMPFNIIKCASLFFFIFSIQITQRFLCSRFFYLRSQLILSLQKSTFSNVFKNKTSLPIPGEYSYEVDEASSDFFMINILITRRHILSEYKSKYLLIQNFQKTKLNGISIFTNIVSLHLFFFRSCIVTPPSPPPTHNTQIISLSMQQILMRDD